MSEQVAAVQQPLTTTSPEGQLATVAPQNAIMAYLSRTKDQWNNLLKEVLGAIFRMLLIGCSTWLYKNSSCTSGFALTLGLVSSERGAESSMSFAQFFCFHPGC